MPNRERILIVEDDADTREALFTLVTNRGYSALTADNGQQALDLLERGIRPKLILIDLMMPKVNGQDLIDHLRSTPGLRMIPTIVITGMPKEQVRVIADAVFYKPLDYAALMNAVESHFAAH
jgi:CheY-like chemotaxis protein